MSPGMSRFSAFLIIALAIISTILQFQCPKVVNFFRNAFIFCVKNVHANYANCKQTKKSRRNCSDGLHFLFFIFNFTSSFPDVYRHRVREGDAVGSVESMEVHLARTEAEGDGREGAQQLAMRARLQLRQGHFVPPLHLRAKTHLEDEVVFSAMVQPCFEDVADAEALALQEVEPPRALQQKPELHEALLSVVNLYHREYVFENCSTAALQHIHT